MPSRDLTDVTLVSEDAILGDFRPFYAILGHFRPFLGQIFRQFFFAQIVNPATEVLFSMYGKSVARVCFPKMHFASCPE